MKVRAIIWAIQTIIEFIICLYHELCHWIAAYICFFITLGDITPPKLKVTRYPSVEILEDNRLCTYSCAMHVEYRSTQWFDDRVYYGIFVAVAPILGCILLLIISPMYMWLLYICHIDTLWLSIGDIKSINNNIDVYKNNKKHTKMVAASNQEADGSSKD